MELRDGLEEMHESHLTDELDELQARMQMLTAVAFIFLMAVATLTLKWVSELEGRM